MELVTKVGYCRYCHTGKMLEVEDTEDLTQEDLNVQVTEECDCYQATDARKKAYQKNACLANIEQMLQDKRPEIADILRTCIEALQERKIKKITINTYGNFTAKMYSNKDGIKIEVEKKLKEENLA